MMVENSMDACDAPLLELQIQIAGMWNDRKQLRERIKNLETVIERQKETIKCQGVRNEEKHNILCGVKEAVDKYFGDKNDQS